MLLSFITSSIGRRLFVALISCEIDTHNNLHNMLFCHQNALSTNMGALSPQEGYNAEGEDGKALFSSVCTKISSRNIYTSMANV